MSAQRLLDALMMRRSCGRSWLMISVIAQRGLSSIIFCPVCFCPVLELVVTYLASKTKRIRLGHGIVKLLSRIKRALRVTERIAVLDLLSDGRVRFGGGCVTMGSELEAFGVDPADARRQWEEARAHAAENVNKRQL